MITTISPIFVESNIVTLKVIDSLKPSGNSTIGTKKRNRRVPHEGRLFPPGKTFILIITAYSIL